MDTQKIISLRLKIQDPHGFPKIVSSDIPDEPDELTCYRTGEDAYYNSDHERLHLYLSDATLDAMITAYGDGAECRCYMDIAKSLGMEMRIKRLTTGTETTEWQTLVELYTYYKALSDQCKTQLKADTGQDTGRVGQSKTPEICGGWQL